MSATDFLKDVRAGGMQANTEKYAGKQIAVTGRVRFTSLTSTPIRVTLVAGGITDLVSGDFEEEEKEKVAALKEGQNVTMQCVGGEIWGSLPQLKRCTIVKVE